VVAGLRPATGAEPRHYTTAYGARTKQMMSGEDLIRQFESNALQPESFHHVDHVRLAFEYLSRFAVLEALSRFSEALQRFAAAQGKATLYHETITWAYLFLIRERIARAGRAQDWEEFAACNPDLLIWKGGVLSTLYRQETLDSEIARRTFVLPDRGGTCGSEALPR
jgi:hypothetical protein